MNELESFIILRKNCFGYEIRSNYELKSLKYLIKAAQLPAVYINTNKWCQRTDTTLSQRGS